VGKTELARALATFLFGSPQRLLRFDLSEFKDYGSFEMLLGDPDRPDKPARLIDPVRANPFQVVLFDELEKAHPNIWDLLLPLLDEGRLTAPGGETVDFRNTIIIATSNAGAQESERAVGFGAQSAPADRESRMRRALEAAFRPEFLNRFQYTVVFHALSKEQMRTVARQEMGRVLKREGISGRNLIVDIDDEALDLVIDQGIDARFGARALKRELQRRIVLPLAMTLMEREVFPDAILKVLAKDGAIRIKVLDTASSRAHKKEHESIRASAGRGQGKAELVESLRRSEDKIESIADRVDEPTLLADRDRLTERMSDPGLWKDSVETERVQRELYRTSIVLERLARLRSAAAEVREALQKTNARPALAWMTGEVAALEESASDAERELLRIGWDGSWDALVEIRPLGGAGYGKQGRDLLVQTYLGWASHRGLAIEWLREPVEDEEPAVLGLKGLYAHGMLRAEMGLHRVRLEPEDAGEGQGKVVVAAVRVIAWTDAKARPEITSSKALKGTGQYGGKIRSKVECHGGLVLQNARTIAENKELAAEVGPSWAEGKPAPEDVVRRYDVSPLYVRDALTGLSTGKTDALSPKAFDALLKSRIDWMAGMRNGD
jgi:hypothetical protein